MARPASTKSSNNHSANIGFEQKLWLAADNFELRISSFEFPFAFRRDLRPDLRADFVLANPPFNDSDWFRKDDDPRWQFGLPPRGNANFAWVQYFIHHLAPTGMAGFVLVGFWASLKSQATRVLKTLDNSTPDSLRECGRALVESDLVACHARLPRQRVASSKRRTRWMAA